MKSRLWVCDAVFIALVSLLCPLEAFAYLDPGTGSMLVSVFIGVASSAYFALRNLPAMIRRGLFRLQGGQAVLKKNSIVMYAESAAYWSTFKPLLDEFARRGAQVLYLTSNEQDPFFKTQYPDHIRGKYIGQGNAAYTMLNFIEADVCVLTTPGLDVLQIKRSKGVGRYIHVIHSLTDVHFYKPFAFDYYDEVICSGYYQVRSIRAIEQVRKNKPKDLPVLGCPYVDLVAQGVRRSARAASSGPVTVLLAPTWGRNGMLTRIGPDVPKVLAEAGFHIIFRPHPQCYVSEKDLIGRLEKELSSYPNLEWDRNPDGIASLARADILVSDLSGIIFDYVFGFLRPVIAVTDTPVREGFEAFDIPHELWDFELIDQVGCRIGSADLDRLPALVERYVQDRTMHARILELRDRHLANYGCSAGPIAEEILRHTSEGHHA